ncbi:biopolymer transporter ExbD [Bacteroidia bacterium]|nr:biopolymer transporter ExbD [Bacteroidia bacterium]MDC1395218.1 biopolymer transporter ExbD [Bacteroidia bacterium]
MNLRQNSRVNTEFNASSMTDIVFLLLIFFIIISSVVKDPALKLVLPKGVNNVSTVAETIVISVDKNLNYAIGEKKTTFGRLPFELRKKLNGNTNATVSIRGDKDVRYEDVMNLVMLADKEGAKVVLALDAVKR